MNKILNWTLGGFFRTLGRLLVYVLIGILAGIIITNSGFKLPRQLGWLLGIEKINASTISPTNKWLFESCDISSDCAWSSLGNLGSNYFTSSTATYEYLHQGVLRSTFNYQAGVTYTIKLRVSSTPQFKSTTSYSQLLLGSSSENGTYSSDVFTSIQFLNVNYISNTNITEFTVLFTPNINLAQVRYYLILNKWYTFESPEYTYFNFRSDSVFTSDTSTQDAINNQTDILINNYNNNTQDIIDNAQQNAQDIINNQNENTEKQIESQKVCQQYGKLTINYKYISGGGYISDTTARFGVSDYINIYKKEVKILYPMTTSAGTAFCLYNVDKGQIGCYPSDTSTFPSVNNAYYLRYSYSESQDRPQFEICSDGNQALNDTLNDDNTSDAENEAKDFFDNFTSNDHGLTGIITAPLNAIESLTSATCSPLVLPIPFVNQNLTLPCMRQIYVDNFGSFMTLYDVITLGIVSYWIMVRIFGLVKDFKNPDHDEIEVVDL